MPEHCPLCGRLFLSYRRLSYHLDAEHPLDYASNAAAVLNHARKKAREHDERQLDHVDEARTRTVSPGEPLLPRGLAACSPYVTDVLGDVLNLFGNLRTLHFFLRHEKLVHALVLE